MISKNNMQYYYGILVITTIKWRVDIVIRR